jgi:cbb3-type cytochrome oxidase subunit 3
MAKEIFRAMNQRTLPIRLALIVVGVVVLFASSLPAMAQSCALCYTQAASAGSRMIEALKSGILILIVPPTLMSIGMVFIMYRNRHRCRNAANAAESDAIWKRTDLSIATTTPWLPIHAITDPPAKNTFPSKPRDYLPVSWGP